LFLAGADGSRVVNRTRGRPPVADARRLLVRGVSPVVAAVEVGFSISPTDIATSGLGWE
jgi:hypothetical protein